MGVRLVRSTINDTIQRYRSNKIKLPLKIANTIQTHFVKGFSKGGGTTNKSMGGWAKRKTPSSRRARNRNVGRAILVDRGVLRADIQKRKVSYNRIVVGTSSATEKYAKYINDGTPKMVQREFIGDSRVLEQKIKNQITRELGNILR